MEKKHLYREVWKATNQTGFFLEMASFLLKATIGCSQEYGELFT